MGGLRKLYVFTNLISDFQHKHHGHGSHHTNFPLIASEQTHTNVKTCQVDGYGIKHGLMAVALQMPYVAVCAETSFFCTE